MKILMLGDIFGRDGRRMVSQYLSKIKNEYQVDVVLANGENAAHGKGLSRRVYDELIFEGISLISMGNHTYSKSDIFDFIDDADRLVVPINRPRMLPGVGSRVIEVKGKKIRLTNLLGVTFMNGIVDHPFLAMDDLLENAPCDIHILDFHAEATSEKIAMGYYLNGRVSAVLGTHTHVQTADEVILDKGTAYITDIGMTGPQTSVIGCEVDSIIKKMVTGQAGRFQVATGKGVLCAVLMDFDDHTNKPISISRIQIRE